MLNYCLKNPVDVFKDICVGKSEEVNPLMFDKDLSFPVVLEFFQR
jgi:hypothetical protein